MDSRIVEKYEQKILNDQLNETSKRVSDNEPEDIDLDELLDDLDDNDAFSRYREQRLQEISSHLKRVEKNVRYGNYGILDTIDDESKLIHMSSEINKIIIHFEIESFAKCQYMNEKLKFLATKYLDIKFVKITVEKCPFLVKKLKIKVLPFVIGYQNGLEKLRLVGFKLLGNDPNGFPLENLETQLSKSGFIDSFRLLKSTNDNKAKNGIIARSSIRSTHSESDSGLDI